MRRRRCCRPSSGPTSPTERFPRDRSNMLPVYPPVRDSFASAGKKKKAGTEVPAEGGGDTCPQSLTGRKMCSMESQRRRWEEPRRDY